MLHSRPFCYFSGRNLGRVQTICLHRCWCCRHFLITINQKASCLASRLVLTLYPWFITCACISCSVFLRWCHFLPLDPFRGKRISSLIIIWICMRKKCKWKSLDRMFQWKRRKLSLEKPKLLICKEEISVENYFSRIIHCVATWNASMIFSLGQAHPIQSTSASAFGRISFNFARSGPRKWFSSECQWLTRRCSYLYDTKNIYYVE